MANKRSIFDETSIVQNMNNRTDVVEALLNGTFAITQATNKSGSNRSLKSLADYIPKEQEESNKSYNNRLLRTYITPYLANAIDSATGQIFKTPPHIQETKPLDERLSDYIKYDVDFSGSDITEFSIDAMRKSMAYGMALAVGYFYNPTESSNLSVQNDAGARPYVKIVSPRDLLGYSVDVNGKITMIRFLEDALIDDEEFGSSTVKRVRRITPTSWHVYETDEKGVDQIVEEGEIVRFDPYNGKRIIDRVPCEVLYGRKINVLNATSVFEDLAWINVHHTQVNSDMTWSSHFSLIPFLAAYLDESIDPEDFSIGVVSSQINVSLRKGSKIEWVETGGKPQEMGAKKLADIEEKIQISTMSSNVGATGSKETATGRAIDANSQSSKLRGHSEALESWITRVIDMLASFMKGIDSPNIEVSANKEFDVLISAEEIKLIQEDFAAGRIDRNTYFTEMKRRGIYKETVTLEDIDKGKVKDIESKPEVDLTDDESSVDDDNQSEALEDQVD